MATGARHSTLQCHLGRWVTWATIGVFVCLSQQGIAALKTSSAASTARSQNGENPLIARYKRRTMRYKYQAKKAEKEALAWAARTKGAVWGGAPRTQQKTLDELNKLGAGPWANAAWRFEQMLDDPRAARAAAAASQASVPYTTAFEQYAEARDKYTSAAMTYAGRAETDAEQARQLLGQANQYMVQGDTSSGDMYEKQSELLMEQAETFKGLANEYTKTSRRINSALPTIQAMGKQAGAFAAWQQNPTNALPSEQLYQYTIVPTPDPKTWLIA